MRKHGFHQKNRRMALIVAALFGVLSFAGGLPYGVYADEDTKTTTEAPKEGVKDVTPSLMKSDHGQIVFWEWQKVTPANVESVLKDGKYHASMYVMLKDNKEPVGFMSTYADKDHVLLSNKAGRYKDVFGGPDSDDMTGNYNLLCQAVKGLEKESFIEVWTPKPVSTSTASRCFFNFGGTAYLKQDEDGYSLNDHKEYFKSDKFYTGGGSMGVMWTKYLDTHPVYFKLQGKSHTGYVVDMALSRASSKNNPSDTSYNTIGQNLNGNKDYFLRMGKSDALTPYQPSTYRGKVALGLSDKMAKSAVGQLTRSYDFVTGGDKNFSYETGWREGTGTGYINGPNPNDEKCWPVYEMSQKPQNYDYHETYIPTDVCMLFPFKGDPNEDRWVIEDYNASAYLIYNNGLFFEISKQYYMYEDRKKMGEAFCGLSDQRFHGSDQLETEISSYYWYVGTPHTFSTLTSGKAGETVTVGKGETLVIKDASYVGADGNLVNYDGTVLPEGSTLVVEDGGVVSVEGSFINNGVIRNEGGTIVVKDSGTVWPFAETSEGRIECTKSPDSGRSGDMIIMEKGKVFCLIDKNSYTTKKAEAALKVTGGTVINYGTLVTGFAAVAAGSKIENRKNAVFLPGHNRKSDSVELNKSKVTKDGAKELEEIPDQYVTKVGDSATKSTLLTYYHTGVHGVITKSLLGGNVKYSRGKILNDPTATVVKASTYVQLPQETSQY